uniref:Acid sugar phosphatase n=1 Tax=Thermogemmatispora argillosa TaxID=2045280 RepID=A0A455T1I2_9CHLR|nr:acid sugar phosphatase [Thermogemmatispora argillosa]
MLPYTTYLIDLDGVVYRGNELLPGAREFVQWLEATGKKYIFLTNNSFATGSQILAKLERLGIPATPEHLMSAGQAAMQNIARRLPGARVYIVGEQPLVELAQEYGLTVVEVDAEEADVVLVGLDRFFDYSKLTCAVRIVLAGALFITINRDPLLPIAGGGFLPGCGTLAAAIEAGTGVTPEVVGKPEPMLLLEAMERLGSKPEETAMIGDGLDVDILAGQAAGTHTILVLSGRNNRADIEVSPIKPEHVYEDLADLLRQLQQVKS